MWTDLLLRRHAGAFYGRKRNWFSTGSVFQ